MPLAPRLPSLLIPVSATNTSAESSSTTMSTSLTITRSAASNVATIDTNTTSSSNQSSQRRPSTPANASSASQPRPSTSTNSLVTSHPSTTTNSSSASQSRPSTPTDPARTVAEALQARDALHAAYTVAMPSPVRKTASRQALASENEQLCNLLKVAGIDLDKNYVQMVLMERENGNMCQQLYAKKNKPKRTYTTGKARLMTSAEMQQALLDELHKKQMTGLHSEMKKKWFPAIRKEIAEAEKAEKAAAKKREQEVKAATKAAEKEAKAVEKAAAKAKKAAEKEAAKAAKAAAKGRGRGQGGLMTVDEEVGRGKVQESEDEEESSPETDSSDEESDLDEQVVGTNPGPNATNDESSDEETDFDEPAVTTKPGPGALSVMQDESDDNDESEQEETEIGRFNGHRWEAHRNLQAQVVWTDGDVTWEPLSSVNDCAAMEDYLVHRDVDDPLLLSKRKFLINTALRASNE
ncbi:hypothetical protein DFH07DRAFT_783203 [Mycena maculata]|uniref:Chromo domain-containing protein n=1 Tax=Mycena maculata TaxID=230809 RepID=A0AAD7MN47_9AGAR|nr:hypothetical protein DFH07DRAFT_783203 [Mycena maculata]